MNVRLPFALSALLLLGFAGQAQAHCQVPCGIYDDHARVHAMLEDAQTIEKAITEMTALVGKADAQSFNQAARWVATKEQHATHIQEVVATYFLTQRVKPGEKDTAAQLAALHEVLFWAMKTKQSVDPANVAKLRAAITKLETWWPPAKK